MTSRMLTALAATATVAVTTGLLTATTAAAVAAKHGDDLNGDGYRDLVSGSGSGTVGGMKQAGAVCDHDRHGERRFPPTAVHRPRGGQQRIVSRRGIDTSRG
ncbi:hypothetical protein [Streptomyces sp. NPDC012466]|uniref:hypothetical protein n=1 Tax=Streptomyces sp. NPDC012466 TaxID=3364835 RepID=UPI0036E86163